MSLESIWKELHELQEKLDGLVRRVQELEPQLPKPTLSPEPERPRGESWEQRLGRRWMVVVGVIAMVIAVGYEVRLAIEKGWITESMRCAGAAMIGVVLFASGLNLRHRMARFAEILMSGGVVAVMIGIYAAHYRYHLLDPTTALAMIATTAIGGSLLSWRCQARSPIYIGVVGTYLAPIWVQASGATLLSFFTFLTVVNIGTIVLTLVVRLFAVQVIALYLSTVLYVYAYFIGFAQHRADEWSLAFGFLSLQTICFGLASLLPAWLRKRSLSENETWALFPALLIYYYLAGELLQSYAMNWHLTFGVVTSLLALAVAQIGRRHVSAELRQHDGSLMTWVATLWITLHLIYVHSEKVLLSWLLVAWFLVTGGSQRLFSTSKFLKLMATAGLFLVTWRLTLAFGYGRDAHPYPFLNGQFFLIVLVAATLFKSLAATGYNQESRQGIAFAAHLMLLRALYLEAGRLSESTLYTPFLVTLFWVIYAALILTWGQKRNQVMVRTHALWLFGLCTAKVFLYDTGAQSTAVKTGSYFVLGFVLLLAGYFYQRRRGKDL